VTADVGEGGSGSGGQVVALPPGYWVGNRFAVALRIGEPNAVMCSDGSWLALGGGVRLALAPDNDAIREALGQVDWAAAMCRGGALAADGEGV